MSILDSIPVDVFLAIGNACPRPTLNALAQANRDCYKLLNPMLYERNRTQPYPEDSCLFYAIETDNIDTLNRAVQYGADLNIDASHTPAEIDEDIRAHDGCSWELTVFSTPLHHAIRGQKIDIVRWMLDRGARINIATRAHCSCYAESPGVFPLHIALRHPSTPQIAKLLVERGARNVARGKSAIFDTFGIPGDVLDLLISKPDVDVTMKDPRDRNLLHLVACTRSREAVGLCRRLIDAGVPVNECDKGGFTPLCCLSKFDGYLEVSKMLLESGADPNIRPLRPGPPPLLYQLLSNPVYLRRGDVYHNDVEGEKAFRLEVIELILKRGWHPDQGLGYSRNGSCEGATLLLAASHVKNLKCMKLVTDYGANPNAIVTSGDKSMSLIAGVIRSDNYDIEGHQPGIEPEEDDVRDRVRFLLDHNSTIGPLGTIPEHAFPEGSTAMEIAVQIAVTPRLKRPFHHRYIPRSPILTPPIHNFLDILCELATEKNVEESYLVSLVKKCEDMRVGALLAENDAKLKHVEEVIGKLVRMRERIFSGGG